MDGMMRGCKRGMAHLILAVLTGVSSAVRAVSVVSSSGPSADEASAAAAILRADGVVVIKCEALERLAPPEQNAKQILAGMIERVDRSGVDHDQRFSFAEICHRSPRRYDVHLGAGTSESEFSTLFNSLVRPVLTLCCESHDATDAAARPSLRILRDGLVTSLPGASAQPFHADGRGHGLYNAFLPLVPIRTQGTEFWVGSHHDEAAAEKLKQEETGQYVGDAAILDDAEVAPLLSSPYLSRAEGIILFDYRVIHRGRAHGAHEAGVRPVFYRVYALNGVAEDVHNWPETRLPA
jgi:hypothetical protein